MEVYETPTGSIVHLDLYRLLDPGELEPLGLRELAHPGYLWLIEWPDRGTGGLPFPAESVTLSGGASGHEINVTGTSALGETWVSLVENRAARNVDYDATYFLNSMIKKAFQVAVLAALVGAAERCHGSPSAELREARLTATGTSAQLTLDVAGTTTQKVFTLDRPCRVVIDLAHTGVVRGFRAPAKAPGSSPTSARDTSSAALFE